MALALTWNSRVDLNLKFSEFFDSNHTVSAWFMPQFPDSYIGPIVGEGAVLPTPGQILPPNTSAFFVMGTGEYKTSTCMFLRVGDIEQNYNEDLKADTWHHAAVVRDGNTFTLFLNGKALSPPIVKNVSAPNAVPVCLGRTAKWRNVSDHRPAQFYGLIDDVAFYTKALSTTEIKQLAKLSTPLTGNEAGLLAGFPLSTSTAGVAQKLGREVIPQGAATLTGDNQQRSSVKDAKKLPLPTPAFHFTLPVSLHQVLYVGQTPFMIGFSHTGARNFIYDLSPVELKSGNLEAKETHPVLSGILFHALSDGTVTKIHDGVPSGKQDPADTNAMFVSIDGMPGYYWKHHHWKTGTTQVTEGQKVKAGDALAEISDSGVGVGNIHLHTLIVYFPDGGVPPDDNAKHTVTVPFAFTGYFLLDRTDEAGEHDKWNEVDVAIPGKHQVIANSPPFVLKKSGTLSENKDHLHISEKFATERLAAIHERLAPLRSIKTLSD